jgi:phage tail sheath protein FI
MGSRTLSQNDLYNRQNARVVLSLYVRTLKLALKSGLVLKPLTSSGAFLEQLRLRADRVSRAFYNAGLLDGTSENEAFNNKCDSSVNPLSAIQQGVIKLESKIAQIGMTEKIVVTVQEALIGSLNSIL